MSRCYAWLLCLLFLVALGCVCGPPPRPPALTALPTAMPTPVPALGSPLLLQTEARLAAAVVPTLDPEALYAELAPDSVPPSTPVAPRPYKVGDVRRFWLNGSPVEAELVYVTDHAYIWLVVGERVDRGELVAAADRFEAEIYPLVRAAFGPEWSPGIDGDIHISMLHYRDRDDDTAGSFDPSDELPSWIAPGSNETEMFYVNLDEMEPGEDYYFAVLAHEFEHMVHWNVDRNEDDWLDEGLAELACRLTGFDPGSNDEEFFRQPDTQLTLWPYEGDTTPHYGASYLFALYLWERFGDDFIWNLVHQPANGMAAVDLALAQESAGLAADQVFADWVVANVLDAGDYAYAAEDWKPVHSIDATHREYPVSRESAVYPYATDYVALEGRGALLIRFQGTPTATLLTAQPHTGETVWWSNVGNRSDARLIRRFDLSGLSSATLRFWVWYDLENRYDVVYLSASADGRTWEVLAGERATYQGDYGRGYTGRSRGWVEERVDLSRYAGGTAWVRFDHVTDDTINSTGFLVDDFSIPELGWEDPCDDIGEWQADGFVLVGTAVPQRWVVQLIEFPSAGEPARVRRMALDARQIGQLELTLGANVERALLAISALARGATEPAAYWYEIGYR